MRALKIVLLSSILTIGGLTTVSAQVTLTEPIEEEPSGVSPATEIQLRDVTPTIRDIAIKLQGTEKEEAHLKAVQTLVNKILATSKPKVVRVPVEETSPLPVVEKPAEKVTITLNLQPVTEAEQHYKLNITLQENAAAADIVETFDYSPTQIETLQQQLKAFLFKHLDLQAATVQSPVPTQVTEPVEVPTTETLPAMETSEDTALSTATTQPEAEADISESETLPEVETETLPEEDPIVTSPEEEVQLRNLTPPIKDISIRLRGTEKEQAVLKTVQTMVNDILNNAKVAVVRVPTTETPTTTPVLEIYENLEIVIAAHAPADVDEPYKINVALQEEGIEEGKFKVFDYFPEKSDDFKAQLQDYLYKQIHLQPK